MNLPNSYERDNYLEAFRNATNLISADITILEAIHEPFENRIGGKLKWIFISYFILSTVFVLLLLGPGYNSVALEKSPKRNSKN